MTLATFSEFRRGSRWRDLGRGAVLCALSLAAASNVAPELSAARPRATALQPPLPVTRLVPTRKVVEAMGSRSLLDIAAPTALAMNAARPINAAGLEVAPPFHFSGDGGSRARALDCLAAAAWYEAGDDALGERSVLQVVLNRARHPAYRSSICGVVFQGSERGTGCQFTFTCDGALARTPSAAAWDRARKLASAALDGAVFADVGSATHYHTDWVVPLWGPKLDKIAKVRTHIFYRFPGGYGRRAVLGSGGSGAEPFVAQLARLSPAHLAGASATARLAVAAGQVPGLGGSGAVTGAAGTGGAAGGIGALDMPLSDLSQPGRWAVQSLSLCGSARPCVVVGRASGRLSDDAPSAVPLFVFVRDGSGAEVPLWDCARVARPDPSQCLPTSRAAIDYLLRRRVNG